MNDTQRTHPFFPLLQSAIYGLITLDIYVHFLSAHYQQSWQQSLNIVLYRIPFISNSIYSHATVFGIIVLVSLTTKAKKDLDYHAGKHFALPFILGCILFLCSLWVLVVSLQQKAYLYASLYFIGALLLHISLTNLSKRIAANLGGDRWNTEQESFMQNTRKVESDYSFNLPMKFYYKGIKKGWININPFRGILVAGLPGSGKSESVIVPFIKQFLGKGFSMLVYDFKYPDLSEITYYHYLLHKNGALKGAAFHAINLDHVEYSRRVNPLHPKYIQTLSDASETAEALIYALQKTEKQSGSSQFFTQSAINFLSACFYYFATKEEGKYSTLPHVLAFISMPYESIFNTLFSHPELMSLLAPFRSAYENRAFDQLEGQIGTVRVNLSRLATKEAFWVFSGHDIDLKISNPKSVLVLANSPATQSVNSAFYAVVVNRITKEVNSKGNNPTALVIDETPTLFLHKIENLIATARSNKVAVVLGLQELPQFHLQYGKDIANTITSIMGTVLSGAVRSKETLEWLEKLGGKIKQQSTGLSINEYNTNVSLNERMDFLLPASKIASLNAGQMVGIVSRENEVKYGDYQPNVFNCKIDLDLNAIEQEKKDYKKLPKYYNFGSSTEKSTFLIKHMQKIYSEVQSILL